MWMVSLTRPGRGQLGGGCCFQSEPPGLPVMTLGAVLEARGLSWANTREGTLTLRTFLAPEQNFMSALQACACHFSLSFLNFEKK